jgi:hypothetical protein
VGSVGGFGRYSTLIGLLAAVCRDGRSPGFILWGRPMSSYRIIYNETPARRASAGRRLGTMWTEEFLDEHQALGRARELLETGEHHGVAMHDHSGNELSGVRLQWKLGGFSGD